MNKKLLYVFLFLLSSFVVISGETNNINPKALLERAKKVTIEATFKSEMDIVQHGKQNKYILYQTFQNGRQLIRSEVYRQNVLLEILISNQDGVFNEIITKNNERMILKCNYPGLSGFSFLKNWNYMVSRIDWNYNCRYAISAASYGDIPCYKITVKAPDDVEGRAKMVNETVEYMKKNQKIVDEKFLAVREFYVGQKDSFIYACAFYNPKGRKIYTRNIGKIELLDNIDLSLFSTPLKYDAVNNEKEFKDILKKAIDIK